MALRSNEAAPPSVEWRDRALLFAAFCFAIVSVAIAQPHPAPGSVSPWPHLLAAAFATSAGTAQVLASWDRGSREQARGRYFRMYAAAGVVLFGGMAVAYLVTAWASGEYDVRIGLLPLLVSLPVAGYALFKIAWPATMSRADAVIVVVDAVVSVLALAVLWWQVVVPRWIVPDGFASWERLDQLVMFLTISTLLVLIVVSRRPGALPLVQLALLVLSMLCYELSDLSGQLIRGSDDTSSVSGAIIGYAVAGALMVTFLHRSPIEDEPGRARAIREWASLLVPVVLSLLAGAFVFTAATKAGGITATVAILAGMTVAAFLVGVTVTRVRFARQMRHVDRGAVARVLADRTREGWFRALVGDSREYVFVLDSDGLLVYASPRVERDVALHDTPQPFDATHRHNFADVVEGARNEQVKLALAQLAHDPSRMGPYDLTLRGYAGAIDVEAVVRPVTDVEFEGYVVTARDVTATRRLQNLLDTSLLHDSLTHLLSREGFLDTVQVELDGDRDGVGLALVVLDLDRFTALNDAYGHDTGDTILCAVADSFGRLPAGAKAAARLSGDSFALLVVAPDPVLAVATVVEQARLDLRGLLLTDGREIEVEFRAGYFVVDDAETPSATWCLEAADLALARARVSRHALLVEYHDDLRAETERRIHVERLIRTALADDGIITYYQPIVRLDNSLVRGAEALVRLRDEEGRLVPPDEFVPLAEEIGLIAEIGRVVLRRACLDTVEASQRVGRPLSVSVNLSADQLVPTLVDEVTAALHESGLSPLRLSLEITETILADQSARTRTVLSDLRSLGVTISLDDFGTGYSSMSYLAQLPVDCLKIDKSFVSVLGSSPTGLTLARLVVQLAEPLGLATIAEGVETLEQADLLRGMGCALAQGYLYSRPVPFEEYVERLIGPMAVRSPLDV